MPVTVKACRPTFVYYTSEHLIYIWMLVSRYFDGASMWARLWCSWSRKKSQYSDFWRGKDQAPNWNRLVLCRALNPFFHASHCLGRGRCKELNSSAPPLENWSQDHAREEKDVPFKLHQIQEVPYSFEQSAIIKIPEFSCGKHVFG